MTPQGGGGESPGPRQNFEAINQIPSKGVGPPIRLAVEIAGGDELRDAVSLSPGDPAGLAAFQQDQNVAGGLLEGGLDAAPVNGFSVGAWSVLVPLVCQQVGGGMQNDGGGCLPREDQVLRLGKFTVATVEENLQVFRTVSVAQGELIDLLAHGNVALRSGDLEHLDIEVEDGVEDIAQPLYLLSEIQKGIGVFPLPPNKQHEDPGVAVVVLVWEDSGQGLVELCNELPRLDVLIPFGRGTRPARHARACRRRVQLPAVAGGRVIIGGHRCAAGRVRRVVATRRHGG